MVDSMDYLRHLECDICAGVVVMEMAGHDISSVCSIYLQYECVNSF